MNRSRRKVRDNIIYMNPDGINGPVCEIYDEKGRKVNQIDYDYYEDKDGIIHDKTCYCKKENMSGRERISPKDKRHDACQRAILVRELSKRNKNHKKYLEWFKNYKISTEQLEQLYLKKVKCTLQNERMYMDENGNRWIIETDVTDNPIMGRLFHGNYKIVNNDKTFNSSAYHSQHEGVKPVPTLIHKVINHY